jgi:hypothetical protein
MQSTSVSLSATVVGYDSLRVWQRIHVKQSRYLFSAEIIGFIGVEDQEAAEELEVPEARNTSVCGLVFASFSRPT